LFKKALILCFIFLFGCAGAQKEMINLPHSKYSWHIKESVYTPDEGRISQAILIFHKRWKDRFGDKKGKVKKSLDNLMIEWSTEEKILNNIGRNNNGDIVKRGRVNGMTLSPTYIWLRANQYERVFATSLMHELVHVALWSQGCSSGDPDHEGGKYRCWTKQHTKFIIHLNNILAKLDI
jgi:hypothetical protein